MSICKVANSKTGPALSVVACMLCMLAASAQDAAQIFEKVFPSVVYITAYDSKANTFLQASGFIVSNDGKVCTNYHAVKNASHVYARLSDGRTLQCTGWISSDEQSDLTILELPLGQYISAELTYTFPRIGSKVFVIGHPQGFQYTITDGILSGYRALKNGGTAIQSTAEISHGSSGSPLLDAMGSVIGVVSFTRTQSQGLNFAISTGRLRPLLLDGPSQIWAFPVLSGSWSPQRSQLRVLTPNETVQVGVKPEPDSVTTESAEVSSQGGNESQDEIAKRRREVSGLHAFRTPTGRTILTNSPERFRNRRGYTEVDSSNHDANEYFVQFTSGHTQTAQKVIDDGPFYVIQYQGRSFRVKKTQIASVERVSSGASSANPPSRESESDLPDESEAVTASIWPESTDDLGNPGAKTCFVATATYGSPDAREVVVLRAFRDRYLIKSVLGRWLVATYYRTSPPLADFIAGHQVLKAASQIALSPVVLVAGASLGYARELGLLALILSLGVAFRWYGKRRVNLTR